MPSVNFVNVIKTTAILLATLLATGAPSVSAKGPAGQTLTVSTAKGLVEGQQITVTGKGYNLKTGIYVAVCVVPPKGKKPEICGPYDVTGHDNQAVWVSSNPPFYGKLFVTPFGRGGTFKVTLPMRQMIDEADCKLVRCAILTRADHTNAANRKADVIIPITFK